MREKRHAGLFPSLEILAKYFSDCTLMKTSTGYWASPALPAILADCLLNPNTYLQNLKFILSVGLLHIKIVQIIIFCSVKSI
jgi:hypothetical protein